MEDGGEVGADGGEVGHLFGSVLNEDVDAVMGVGGVGVCGFGETPGFADAAFEEIALDSALEVAFWNAYQEAGRAFFTIQPAVFQAAAGSPLTVLEKGGDVAFAGQMFGLGEGVRCPGVTSSGDTVRLPSPPRGLPGWEP